MHSTSSMFRQATLLTLLVGCTFIVFHPEWRELVAASYEVPIDQPIKAPDDVDPKETLEQQEKAVEDRLEELRESDDFDLPRWGLFATAASGENERESRRELGYDGKLYGVTFGADYRVSSDLVIGAAVSTFKEKSDLLENAGSIDINSNSLSVYSGYTPTENSHIDFLAGYTQSDFDGARNAPGIKINSVYHGRSVQAALNAGYNYHSGALTFGPLLEVSYTRIENDDKVEKEGGNLAVRVEGKKSSSLITKIGGTASRAISFDWGVFSPFATVFYQHEFLADSVELTVTNISSGRTDSFITDDPDRNTIIGRVGFATSMANNLNFFVSYEQLYAHEYLQKQKVNIGARLEF